MQTDQAKKLSIAVVCFNTPKQQLDTLFHSLAASLDSLHDHDPGIAAVITLVDNSDQPLTELRDVVANSPLGDTNRFTVRLISGHGNIGFARAHNLVIAEMDSDYHLVLNPDVVLNENALVQGIEYLDNHADTVMVSPNATDEQGNKQYLCKRYPTVFLFLLRGFFPNFLKPLFARSLARFEMQDLPEDVPTGKIPIASGCFMLCRSETLSAVNGFDPSYFLYFEDFDLSLRISSRGDIAYLPAMKIVHHGGNSARKGWTHIRMFLRSGIRFFNTHGWRIV